jgi:peptide/nickel transport system permease protein
MTLEIAGGTPAAVEPATPDLDARDHVRRRRGARRRVGVWLAVAWLVLVIAVALLADVLPLADPTANIAPTTSAPFGAWPEFLGTDRLGRSVLSRLAYGARVSLLVGVLATAFGLVVGVATGMLAAIRRASDFALGALIDSLLAVPGVVLLLALGATMGPGLPPLVLGLALYAMPSFARLARATTRVIYHRPHVQAARLMGAGPLRLLVREILPAVLRPVLAYSVVVLASLMVAEASVSYLGLGVPPPTPTWGGMIADGQSSLDRAPYLVLVPAAALFITVLSLGVLGRSSRRTAAGS